MAETVTEEKKEPIDPSDSSGQAAQSKELSLEEMMEAGLHFGHKTSKTHPKMKPYIAGVRNGIHVMNLEKTREKLREALEALAGLVAEGKVVLLVGTKVQVKDAVRHVAEATGQPFVAERWIGGLLTNFEEMQKRIAHLKELEQKKESEDFKKYTKWEQHEMEEERRRLEKKFGGVKNLQKLPDALFIFDLDENQTALREAKQKGILVFAIADTNCDPTSVAYAIPANDDAVSSVKYIAERVCDTIINAKTQTPRETQNMKLET